MIYLQNLTNEFCELRKQYIDAKFMTMNPMQKKAIYNVDGPVLVLAGAGSGKTTTIIGRIVYMVMFGHAYYSTETTFPVTEGDIKELKSVLSGTGSISEHLKSMLQVKPVSPQNIMAVTFTNKAAGEMKKRLESKLGKDTAEKVCAKTFHSACVGILREYAMFVGFKRDFTIYDEKDCKSVLKDIYKANGIKEKELHKDDVLNHISIWKEMHMVTETRQLRDGEKLTKFYNGIDWEPLFEFVRRYFGIGVEQPPTTCLKPNGRIEVNWPENLRDKCGLFCHTYCEVYLQTFSSCCFHDITYDKDIVDKYLARPDFYRLNISLENDCNGTSSDAYLQLTFSLKHIEFSGGYNFANLFSAEYRKDTGWFVVSGEGEVLMGAKK